jgi:hypothetical protein
VSFFGGLFKGIKKVVGIVSPVLKFIGPIGAVARGTGLLGKALGVARTLAGGRPRTVAMPGGAPVAYSAMAAPRRQRTATRAPPRRRAKRKLKFGSPAWRRKYMRRGRR